MKQSATMLVLINREMLKIMSRTDKTSKKQKALRDAHINQTKYKQYSKRIINTRHR